MTDTKFDPATASTMSSGAPAVSDRNSLSVGANGPILLHDVHFLEQMAHFNRERCRASAARQGRRRVRRLETTEDVSPYTKAALFQQGAATEMLARFSTVAGEMGSPDTWRDVRGFSLKFYTSEGNLRPRRQQHPDLLRARSDEVPALHPQPEAAARLRLRDNHMQWDFWTRNPESAHQVTYLMGDRAACPHAGAT